MTTSDFRHALRRLRHDWLFSATAVLILAVGIGANTAVFSMVNMALFRPQSFAQPENLVNVYQNVGNQRTPTGASFAAYRDIARESSVFSDVAAVLSAGETAFQTPQGRMGIAIAEYTTSNFLRVVNLKPYRGRWFTTEEDGALAPAVAVVGYRTWTEMYQSDPNILGQAVRFGRTSVTIVGIAPPELHYSSSASVFTAFWLPISAVAPITGGKAEDLDRRDNPIFRVNARLQGGVSLSQAQAAMTVLAGRLKKDHPDDDPGQGMTVLRTRDVRFSPSIDATLTPAALAVLAIVGLILAIACSNLATLLLVRGAARAKEISVRLALGATRWQLVRHLISESVLLAGLGALGGWTVAAWGLHLLSSVDTGLPIDVTVDYRVLLYTTALSLITGIGSGLAPALASTKISLAPGLREQGSSASTARGWFTLKNVLIVGQISASFLLLIVTGFGVRLLAQASSNDPGFRVDGIAILEVSSRFSSDDRAYNVALMQQLQQRVQAIPAVERVFATNGVPPGNSFDARIELPNDPRPENKGLEAYGGWATPGFFETLNIPVRSGRAFTLDDRPETPRVAIVNQTLARRYFGANAIGKRFRYVESQRNTLSGEAEIVGVVGDISEADNFGYTQPLFYLSTEQAGNVPSTIIARTALDAKQLALQMQAELRKLDPSMPALTVSSMQEYREAGVRPWRNGIAMLGGLGVMGLGLASLGLYAVVAFAVARRTQEVGIRMALGARAPQVVWLMMRDVMILTGVGMLIGTTISIGSLAIMGAYTPSNAQMSIVAPVTDPWNFVVIATAMTAVGLLATYFPARRAAHVDPLTALRDA